MKFSRPLPFLALASALLGTLWLPRAHAQNAAPSGRVAATDAVYRLGPDDVLDIKVSNHPDLASTVTVRPDGKISFAGAGELVARGKTTSQLASEIQTRLARTLNNARVQIVVKQARPRQARIIGAVNTVGTFDIKPQSRLMDLIAMAGGFKTKVSRIKGSLIREGRVLPLQLDKAVQDPKSAANLPLLPDDLVKLDAADFSNVLTVTGKVVRPGLFDLDEDLTVTALLALAGGPLPEASLRNAHILRGGKPALTDLSAAVAGVPTSDSPLSKFKLRPGDILVVPQNNQRFGVMGQITKPGYYPLSENAGEATVLKALSLAGGPLADGDLTQVTITRTSKDQQTQIIPVDAGQLMAGKTPDTLILQNDDVLFVPKKRQVQASVVGQVRSPGTFPLEGTTTLQSLLAQAGNPLKGAGLSRSYVLRGGVQIPLNLRPTLVENRPDAAIANFRLQDNDVLVIPDVSEQIQVVGQVNNPGPYALDDDLTLISLLSKAGNPKPTAALSQAHILRDGQRIELDLRPVVAGNPDPTLASFKFVPGDVLVVPENQRRFGVMGQVARPGYFPFPEDAGEATVLKVLGTTGGPLNTAKLEDAGIVRLVGDQTTVVPVNLAQLLRKGNATDLPMQPGDVLYIPAKKQGNSWLQYLAPLSLLGRLAGF